MHLFRIDVVLPKQLRNEGILTFPTILCFYAQTLRSGKEPTEWETMVPKWSILHGGDEFQTVDYNSLLKWCRTRRSRVGELKRKSGMRVHLTDMTPWHPARACSALLVHRTSPSLSANPTREILSSQKLPLNPTQFGFQQIPTYFVVLKPSKLS